MVLAGDFRVSATLASHPAHPLRRFHPLQKVSFNGFLNGGSSLSESTPKLSPMEFKDHTIQFHCHGLSRSTLNSRIFPNSVNLDTEDLLLSTINMSFFDRLNLAWKILFPPPDTRLSSNAKIAKQRLKMILFSDRCAVSDEAKQKIVSNIVGALSDFVEIESQDKVQLNVSTDPGLGTVYSVTVPIRRVKPEYQDMDEVGTITNIDYKDDGESSGSVDVTFDFFISNEKNQ